MSAIKTVGAQVVHAHLVAVRSMCAPSRAAFQPVQLMSVHHTAGARAALALSVSRKGMKNLKVIVLSEHHQNDNRIET